MKNYNYLTNNEIKKIYDEQQKFRHKCNCGHTVYIANKLGVAECSYCHNLVFKDKKSEFEYRLKQNLIKERRKLK